MNQLIQYGDIKKGRLGATGAQVRNLGGASPAERGGLIANDVVLSLDGRTFAMRPRSPFRHARRAMILIPGFHAHARCATVNPWRASSIVRLRGPK